MRRIMRMWRRSDVIATCISFFFCLMVLCLEVMGGRGERTACTYRVCHTWRKRGVSCRHGLDWGLEHGHDDMSV